MVDSAKFVRFGEAIGGNLSLDFANTVSWDPTDPREGEKLHSYGDLVDWALWRGVLSSGGHQAFVKAAAGAPEDAAAILADARALRGHIHRLFASFAKLGKAEQTLVEPLNQALGKLPWRLAVRADQPLVDWEWDLDPRSLGSLLRPVVWEAVVLLRSGEVNRVRECGGDRCGWLFVDRSRRGNRRWCDMRDCGNRAKVKRHYYRHRTI